MRDQMGSDTSTVGLRIREVDEAAPVLEPEPEPASARSRLRVTFEVDGNARYHHVNQALATGQPQRETECEAAYEYKAVEINGEYTGEIEVSIVRGFGHVLSVRGDTIVCIRCDATWRDEGF